MTYLEMCEEFADAMFDFTGIKPVCYNDDESDAEVSSNAELSD